MRKLTRYERVATSIYGHNIFVEKQQPLIVDPRCERPGLNAN